MIVFLRILTSLFSQPLGAAQAATKGLLAFVGVTRDELGLEDELFLVPVAVVDVGAVETLDHFGGAGAGLDGLEDAEGDQGTATFVVQAVRVDDEGGSPARGSLPGGLAATLVRTLLLFRERLIPAHREKLRSNQCQQESVVYMSFLTKTNLETSIDAARGYGRTSGNRAFKGSRFSDFGCGTAFSFML